MLGLIFNKIRARTRELQEVWKPGRLILSFFSWLGAVAGFQRRAGPFIYVAMGLSVLAIAILFTIPKNSIRLFAKRLVAFLVDLALLGLFTFAIVDLLYKSQVIKPSAIVSMAIVWAWFFIFVFFDWRFAGTPGILLLGLRLKGGNGKVTVIKSLARNLLTLIVPVIGAGRILMVPTVSKLANFAEWSVGITILSLIPLSIAFSGEQSLPDMVLGVAVVPKQPNASQSPVRLRRRDWLLLLVASVLSGVAFASSALYGSSVLERRPLERPIQTVEISGDAEARIIAGLRSNLEADLTTAAEALLQDLRLSTVVGDLPSGGEQVTAPVPCLAAFRAKKTYQIFRAQLNPQTPTLIKAKLLESLGNTLDLYTGRPGFVLLQLSSRESFGFFNFEYSENYIFCLMDSGGKPTNFLAGLSITLWLPVSIAEPCALILGKLDSYSQVEKIPVW